jgi:uncharacterized protein (DUF58 family)
MATISPEILKQVKRIELRTRGLVSSLLSGEYRSVFRGLGMEFAEVRAYQHDDDYRAIDWNVSARLASPYVKTFTEERELTVLLVVDQSGSARFGVSTEVAAVLALAAARQNDRVGALLFTDRVERVVPPAKGRRHALRVIRDILAFDPAGRRTDLAGALTYAARLLPHRSIVVVLSDFGATGWERPMRRLALRHEVVAGTVDDPREQRLPDAGWIELEDQETGRRVLVDSGDAEARARLHAAAQRRQELRANSLRAAGVDQLTLATDRDYAAPLHRAFQRRARRRR